MESLGQPIGDICNRNLECTPQKNVFTFKWAINIEDIKSPNDRKVFLNCSTNSTFDPDSYVYKNGPCYACPPFPLHDATWCFKIYTEGNNINSKHFVIYLKRNSIFSQGYACSVSISVLCAGVQFVMSERTVMFQKTHENSFKCLPITSRLLQPEIRRNQLIISIRMAVSEADEKTVLNFEKLSSSFKDLFINQKHCDVTFKVKGKKFPAHKAILAARSPVFKEMFKEVIKIKTEDETVTIKDVEPAMFRDILLYIYSGEVPQLSTENAWEFFKLFEKYGLNALREYCLNLLERGISMANMYDLLIYADSHNETYLKNNAKYFIAHNAEKILNNQKWHNFKRENPILSMEVLEMVVIENQ